jgi:NAD(P)-dependent dehydrogenase (short-subunit alcohol dehydrogenase family)
MGDLEGKRALVTGAAAGIGRQIAEVFVEQGALVMMADIAEERVAKEAAALGQSSVACDVSISADVKRAVDEVVSTFGGIDIVVSNAGIEQIAPLTEHTESDWDKIFAVNVKSVLFGVQHGAPAIIASGGGNIVNMASVAGLNGCPLFGAYAASKAAVVSITRTAALELRSAGVRVNAVCPAFLATEMVARAIPQLEAGLGGSLEPIVEAIQGRIGTPREAAEVVAFLASDRASFVNGAAYTCDNALTARLI